MSANDGFEAIARRFDEASEARRIAGPFILVAIWIGIWSGKCR